MKMLLQFSLIVVILINELLASPVTQNYASNLNYGTNSRVPANREHSGIRTRKIDSYGRQISVNKSAENNGCTDTFCIDDPNYPKNIIQNLNLNQFEHLFGEEFFDTVSVRFDSDENGLCDSRKNLIFPKRAQTAGGNWLTIINSEDSKYRQGIVVEECRNHYSQCDYSSNFPLGVQTKCKQSYSYRHLVALSIDGRPITENFQFPSCCKCVVTTGHRSDSNRNRFGGGDETNSREYILPY